MAEVHLDHPGDVSWFAGHGPATVLGACPHERCAHNALSNIAWGPDFEHYALNTCDVPASSGGCNGTCRAWSAEYPSTAAFADKPRFRLGPLIHVDTPAGEIGVLERGRG